MIRPLAVVTLVGAVGCREFYRATPPRRVSTCDTSAGAPTVAPETVGSSGTFAFESEWWLLFSSDALWDQDSGVCLQAANPDPECLPISLEDAPSPPLVGGSGSFCTSHRSCGPNEFCGAGACRAVENAVVTACISQVSYVGPTVYDVMSPLPYADWGPILWLQWTDGAHDPGTWPNILTTQTLGLCHWESGNEHCKAWPLAQLPYSTITVAQAETVPAPGASASLGDGRTELSRHTLGDIQAVKEMIDTCVEVPPDEIDPERSTRVWVRLVYGPSFGTGWGNAQ